MQQRREGEDHPRQREEPERHARQIGKLLDGLQTTFEERILQEKNLEHALAPARTLPDEAVERLGLQAGDQRLVDVDRVPALGVELEGGLAILGDGDARKAAGDIERLAPQQRRRAAEERAVPLVEPALRHRIEHLVLGRHVLERAQVSLDRIGIEEDVRGLHEEELRIPREMADGLAQERAEGRMIGIEHDDDLALGLLQAVVHVTGLGVLVLRAGQVAGTHVGAKRLQRQAARLGGLGLGDVRIAALLVGAAVVEEPDRQLRDGIIHRLRGGDRRGENELVFVVGGNEDVDGRQSVVLFALQRFAIQWVGVDDQADDEDQDAIEFGDDQQQTEGEIDRLVERRQGARRAPEDVAHHDETAAGEEPPPREEPGSPAPDRQHGDDDRGGKRELGFDADRLGDQDEREPARENPCGGTHERGGAGRKSNRGDVARSGLHGHGLGGDERIGAHRQNPTRASTVA